MACRYLRGIGYTVLHRNVRMGHDEIDIIALDPADDVLVFAEVKTRAIFDPDFPPEMTAGYYKKKKVRRAARMWVVKNGYEGGWRLDLVTVANGKVLDHFQDLE